MRRVAPPSSTVLALCLVGATTSLALPARAHDGAAPGHAATTTAVSSGPASTTRPWRLRARAARRPSLLRASSRHGELPVIDLTHPAFRVRPDRPSKLRLGLASAAIRSFGRLPRPVRGALATRSAVLGAFLGEERFNDGESTYFAKLGAHAPGNALDRLAARFTTAVLARLDATSDHQARAIHSALSARSTRERARLRPVHFVNIAGGPASDNLNALLKLQHRAPGLLAGRQITITVLDVDTGGVALGQRMLAALQKPGSPLEGLDVTLRHVPYDWSDPAQARGVLAAASRDDAVVVAGSEGGLLHYGSDADVVGNLAEIGRGTPAGTKFVGTAYWDAARATSDVRALHRVSNMGWKLRGTTGVSELAERAGWKVASVTSNAHYAIFTLEKRPAVRETH